MHNQALQLFITHVHYVSVCPLNKSFSDYVWITFVIYKLTLTLAETIITVIIVSAKVKVSL